MRRAEATSLGTTTAVAGAAAFAAALAATRPLLALLLLGALAALGVAAVVVRRPEVSLWLLLGVVILVEDDKKGGPFPNLPGLYGAIPRVPAARLTDALVALVVVAAVVSTVRARRRWRSPHLLTLGLALLVPAIVMGAVTGFFDPSREQGALVAAARPLVYLVVLPLCIVNLRAEGEWRGRIVVMLSVLVAVKSASGIAHVLAGTGRSDAEGLGLTYYQPVTNLLCVVYLLFVAAALAARARIPWPAWLAAALAFTSLLLSLRRSFWLALVFGVLLIIAARAVRRPSAVPASRTFAVTAAIALTAAAFGALAFTGALPGSVQDPVRERVRSISTKRIEANRFDSYRISEQTNVIDALRGSPVLGLGLGVPWQASSPLTLRFDNARLYSHFIVTALWLKIGLLGVLAYFALIAGALRCAWVMWSRAPDPTRAAAGLAVGAGLAGLLVAETTASFTGVDVRATVLVGVLLGFLAAETAPD